MNTGGYNEEIAGVVKTSFCVVHPYVVHEALNKGQIYKGERDSYFPFQVELTAC